MKIPRSVRETYDQIRPLYASMKEAVDSRMAAIKSPKWHYESRIKEIESYALKLETSRVLTPTSPEDMLGCTLVVENHAVVHKAVEAVVSEFPLRERRPKDPRRTSNASRSFGFDDLRLYVAWRDDDRQPPTVFNGRVFEVQIKTFLQHAWGIATHDLLYKSDDVSWGTSRVAYQVKAMLENAEISISEVQRLTGSALLDRSDAKTERLGETIRAIRQRWTEPERLPRDLVRLSKNLMTLADRCGLSMSELWSAVDDATGKGRGASVVDLSPYSAVVEALVAARGPHLFAKLKDRLFVPSEVALPPLSDATKALLISAVPEP